MLHYHHIHARRVALRYSQEEFARLTGITPSIYKNFETGKGQLPSHCVGRLLMVLQCTLSELEDDLVLKAELQKHEELMAVKLLHKYLQPFETENAGLRQRIVLYEALLKTVGVMGSGEAKR